MILIAIIAFALVLYLIWEYIIIKRLFDESENRIVAMLNKAIDNVHMFFVGIFVGLWNWGDSGDDDNDELTD